MITGIGHTQASPLQTLLRAALRPTAPPRTEPAAPTAPTSREKPVDEVTLSPRAIEAADTIGRAERVGAVDEAERTEPASGASETTFTEEDRRTVDELKVRDREVRAHEQAHKSAGGGLAGAISYEFTVGPDGARYATGGEVPIDTSQVKDDPQATIRKMQQVRRAALAPKDPSGADRAIATKATQQERQARTDLLEPGEDATTDRTGEATEDRPDKPATDNAPRDHAVAAYAATAATSRDDSPAVDLLG